MGFAFNLAPLPFRTPLVDDRQIINNQIWLRALVALYQSVNQRAAPTAFAQLPTQPVEGMVFGVTDSTTNTWGAIITGGGALHVLAYYNGTNWTVAGK